MGFGMRYNQGKIDFNIADAGEKSSEDSDIAGDESTCASFLNFDSQIENLCYTKITADYGFLAIISKNRFSIYYIYEDE